MESSTPRTCTPSPFAHPNSSPWLTRSSAIRHPLALPHLLSLHLYHLLSYQRKQCSQSWAWMWRVNQAPRRSDPWRHSTRPPLMLSVARPISFVMLLVLLRIRHWERTYMFPPFDCCADAFPAGVATLFHVLSQSPLTRLPPPHSILSANVHYIPFWGCLHPSHSNRYAYRNERCR